MGNGDIRSFFGKKSGTKGKNKSKAQSGGASAASEVVLIDSDSPDEKLPAATRAASSASGTSTSPGEVVSIGVDEDTPPTKSTEKTPTRRSPKIKREVEDIDAKEDAPPKKLLKPARRTSKSKQSTASSSIMPAASKKPLPQVSSKGGTQLWVDKYAPKSLDELVGNKTLAKKLADWLNAWKDKFLRGDGHSRKMKDRSDGDHPAAMLAGPPGIGKTTTAHAVCKAEGFEPLEFNASDVRNKGGIQAIADSVMVAETMKKYLKFSSKPKESHYPNGAVLVMDEVDGMSGGDRGGNAELIKLIKTTKIPIIVICNDDNSQKMRSLAGNCFKLKFRRPTAKMSAKRMLEICMREGFLQVKPATIEKLCEECNGDLRQMINLLQTWRLQSKKLEYGDVKGRLKSEGKTVMTKSVFDLAMSFFRPGPPGTDRSFEARTENYFCDADLVPLFIQENYINSNAAMSDLNKLADAAESISEADMCNNLVRGQQRWDLMPTAAVLSSIRPGFIVGGGLSQQPMFPSFFGKLSQGNKFKRIVQELEMKVKTGAQTSGSARAFRLDYIPTLTVCLATPLIIRGPAGCDDVISRLDAYYLEKDPDWTDILECGVYEKGRGPLESIKGPVKTTLTREYKARDHVRSSVTGVKFGVMNRRAAAGSDISRLKKNAGEGGIVDDEPESADEEDTKKKDDDDMSEFMVKKSAKKSTKAKTSKKRTSSSATRGSAQKRRKRS